MELTDKQERFCQEYLKDANATQAAIRAGYSEKTARSLGQRLLTNVDIKNRLDKLREPLEEQTTVSRNRIIEEYAKIAFSNVKDIFMVDNQLMNVCQMDDDVAAAVSSVETYEDFDPVTKQIVGTTKKVKLYDKIRALDSLGKIYGIFEKDNSQKGQGINIGALSNDVLKALIDASK